MTHRIGPSALLACLIALAVPALAQDDAAPDATAAPDTAAPEAEAPEAEAPDAQAPEVDADAQAPEVDAGDPNLVAASEEDGRYYTVDDVPTFNVAEDGTVDWPTYSGFRRYHAECHVCHGPDGEGSSYAPALKNSAVTMDYYDFYDVVVNGRQNVGSGTNSVMPAFGDNANVMCYLDDIYVYLKARGADAVPRGRPASREDKSDVIREDENACLGT